MMMQTVSPWASPCGAAKEVSKKKKEKREKEPILMFC